MATKEHKRHVRQVIETLELRVHSGPPIACMELQSVQDFLGQNGFSPASDYYSRLAQLKERIHSRAKTSSVPAAKGNYGGEAAGRRLQVQSVFDHIIISTCYEGDFHTRHGRIKLSHRFNQEGRIDFVELKFLQSLHPSLTGEIRKLLLVREYQSQRTSWFEAEAFVLPVLPQELIFLFSDLFRGPRAELLAWLINIGHGVVSDLVEDLSMHSVSGSNIHRWREDPVSVNYTAKYEGNRNHSNHGAFKQAALSDLTRDAVAWPILNKAASLHSLVEIIDAKTVQVRYLVQAPVHSPQFV